MGISNNTIMEIKSFDLKSGTNIDNPYMRKSTAPEEGHLVISLGGSGASMLLEIKSRVEQSFCSDYDQNKRPERVEYLAFDSDMHLMEALSGMEAPCSPGSRVELEQSEIEVLGTETVGLLPGFVSEPWISSWYDERVPLHVFNGLGAGAYRHVGRLLLFLNADRVMNKLRAAMERLVRVNGCGHVNVYILAGLSGGTGSGTFLDIAYMAREAAELTFRSREDACQNTTIWGYFLLPDVDIIRFNGMNRHLWMANAGAALRELDHAMKRAENGERFVCRYSQNLGIDTDRAPFDFINLVGAKRNRMPISGNQYRDCIGTVAESICSIISCVHEYGVRMIREGISEMQSQAAAINGNGHRSCYTSLGSASWEIPADFITKCAFTAVFERLMPLCDHMPEQQDVYRLLNDLGLRGQMGVQAIRNGDGRQTIACFGLEEMNSVQLCGEPVVYFVGDGYWNMVMHDATQQVETYLRRFEHRFADWFEEAFKDCERGPIWLYFALRSYYPSDVTDLQELTLRQKMLVAEQYRRAKERAGLLLAGLEELRNRINHNTFLRLTNAARGEYLAMIEEYFDMRHMSCYCRALLGIDSKSGERGDGFYDRALEMIKMTCDKVLAVNKDIFFGMRNVIRNNLDLLREEADHEDRDSFNWFADKHPGFYYAIRDKYNGYGVNTQQLTTVFLRKLYEKWDAHLKESGNSLSVYRTAGVDGAANGGRKGEDLCVKEFVLEFLDEEAGQLFNLQLEELLGIYMDRQALEESIQFALMPGLVERQTLMFDGTVPDCSFSAVLVPRQGINGDMSASPYENAVNAYWAGRNDCLKWASAMRYRIALVRWVGGIELSDYALMEECEKAIAAEPDAVGRFLKYEE